MIAKMNTNNKLRKTANLKKAVLFAVILLGLFIILNKVGITGFATSDTTTDYKGIDSIITLDVSDLQYQLITGETKSFVFYIKNQLQRQITVEIGATGKVSNFISVEQKNYIVPSESSIPVQVKLMSSLEAIPQLYFGQIVITTEGKGKLVPIQIDVKKRAQDAVTIRISTDRQTYALGEEMNVGVKVDNAASDTANVQLELKLMSGDKEVFKDNAYVQVDQQVFKTFKETVPKNIAPGSYGLEVTAVVQLGDQQATIKSTQSIQIDRPYIIEQPSQTKSTFMWWVMMIIILGALSMGTAALVRQEVITVPQIKEVLGIKPKSEDENAKQFVKESFSYVIDEKGTRTSYEAIKMLHHEDYGILCITRLNPKLLVEEMPELKNAKIHWLTTQEAENTLGPTDIEGIYNAIEKFANENPKSAVILDGLSFLSVNVSFSQVLLLLQYIKDKISTTKTIFIAPLNTNTLNKKEKEQISDEITILSGEKEILLEMYRKADERDDKNKIEISDQIVDYIKKQLEQGFSEKQISSILVQHGWPKKIMEKAMEKIKGSEKNNQQSQNPVQNQQSQREFGIPSSSGYSSGMPAQVQIQAGRTSAPGKIYTSGMKPQENKDRITAEVQALRREFASVEEMMYNAMAEGKNVGKLDMELAMLTSDIEIADITRDQKDITKIRTKLNEMKRQMGAVR